MAMILEHIRKAGRDLSLYTALHHQRDRINSIVFDKGYIYKGLLFYIFKITLNKHSEELLGLAGGFKSFKPYVYPPYLNTVFTYRTELVEPLIRIISHKCEDSIELEDERELVLMERPCDDYSTLHPESLRLDPQCHLTDDDFTFIGYQDNDKYSVFNGYATYFHTMEEKDFLQDLEIVKGERFLSAQLLLSSDDFSFVNLIDDYMSCWGEELENNYRAPLKRRPNTKARIPKNDKKVIMRVHGDVKVLIESFVQFDSLIEYAQQARFKSMLEIDLKEAVAKTSRVVKITCFNEDGEFIKADRYLCKVLAAAALTPNAVGILFHNFVYDPKFFYEATLASSSIYNATLCWFPTFSLVSCHLFKDEYDRISAVTEGMSRYGFHEIYIPPLAISHECLLSILVTIGRANLENHGNLGRKRITLGDPLLCEFELVINENRLTHKKYLYATPISAVENVPAPYFEPFDFKSLSPKGYPI